MILYYIILIICLCVILIYVFPKDKTPFSSETLQSRLNKVNFTTLNELHQSILGVDMSGELPEQELIFTHLDRDSKGVLEFGGNIGRSSLVINKLMKHPEHHVVFESDPVIAQQLESNRDTNHCSFQIIPACLSDKPMVQNGWNTAGDTTQGNHWKSVPNLPYSVFKDQYSWIEFDTLVVDCEGCLASILKDHGDDLLSTIQTIIIEHDDRFNPSVPQNYIRPYLLDHGFESVQRRDLNSDHINFYEILRKRS